MLCMRVNFPAFSAEVVKRMVEGDENDDDNGGHTMPIWPARRAFKTDLISLRLATFRIMGVYTVSLSVQCRDTAASFCSNCCAITCAHADRSALPLVFVSRCVRAVWMCDHLATDCTYAAVINLLGIANPLALCKACTIYKYS